VLEQYATYVLLLGAALAAVAYIWLLIKAFRTRLAWGIGMLLFPPTAFLFVFRHFRASVGPLLVFLLGGLAFAAPYAWSYYEHHFTRLGPHERVVDGELRITLTGLEGFDYSSLADQRDSVVVLQMANEDVDDQTLRYLRGMDRLRELDLNGAHVTDDGLLILAELPRLESLRLARTRITDEGFQKHLANKESLLKLDLTGVPVKGKTKRAWKKANTDRDYVD
jgi:hypothetical protein